MNLIVTKRTDARLLERMAIHYSQPKGFVGRNICYSVMHDGVYYGHIVGGSATRFLPGRNEFLGIDIKRLNSVVNNTFFNVSPIEGGGKYPFRNFTSSCVELFCETVAKDWQEKYGDKVVGFESLIEKPRTGELYIRAGWKVVGETVGYTCKRISGKGTDSWTGKRVWNTNPDELRPKLVVCFRVANVCI